MNNKRRSGKIYKGDWGCFIFSIGGRELVWNGRSWAGCERGITTWRKKKGGEDRVRVMRSATPADN